MDIEHHLRNERHVQIERYSGISWDEETACFPLWNLSGQYQGYQQYRPEASKEKQNDPKSGRYYTYRTKTKNHPGNRETNAIAVFGTETLYNKQYNSNILFITEGIFDSVRIHNLNLPAIATLSNDAKYLLPWLFLLPYYRIVIADNDENGSGKKLTKVGHSHKFCTFEKDLGDMSDIEIQTFMKEFIK